MSAFPLQNPWELSPVPSLVGYVVRLTNGSQAALPTLVLRAVRQQRPPLIHTVRNLAPGGIVALPAGTVDDLSSYEAYVFDTGGHMLARVPRGTGSISPVEAASTLPLRSNDHTDDWTITEADLLDANEEYTVEVVNATPDTWDEVSLFFANGVTNLTEGFSSSAVSPGGRATFPLGPAGAMNGYVFSVWNDGLRAELAGGALQFPPEGLMTAERALGAKGDGEPAKDVWVIGDQP